MRDVKASDYMLGIFLTVITVANCNDIATKLQSLQFLTKCRTYRLLQNKRFAEEIPQTDFGKKLPFFAHRIFYLDFSG